MYSYNSTDSHYTDKKSENILSSFFPIKSLKSYFYNDADFNTEHEHLDEIILLTLNRIYFSFSLKF